MNEETELEKLATQLLVRVSKATPADCRELFDEWRDAFHLALKYPSDERANAYVTDRLSTLVLALKARGINTI